MNWFRHLPLSGKLTAIIAFTTVTAMVLASAAIVAYQILSFRDFMVSELETTADVIGATSAAAIRFRVPRDAETTLSSLRAKRHVKSAMLLTPGGELFASYARDGEPPEPPAMRLAEGIAFTRSDVISLQHIYHDEDFLGSIQIKSDLDIFYDQLEQSIVTTFVIIVTCSFLALFVSLKILRTVSRPVVTLVETAVQVSQSQDYSLRAEKFSDDDLGALTEEFNDMLRLIQQRDEELEQRVEERTAELSTANDMLANSLEEKVVMLKEIHHRVKNNLQVISSLLSLQTSQIEDESVLRIFANSENRVRAMATIHERLYESDDLNQVDFGQYIQSLAAHLFRTYQISPQHIRLRAEAEGTSLDLDMAIPCGLMINELVSNSLKYAFPDDETGEVFVLLRRTEEGFELRVGDDGVGFPKGVDFRTPKSLGLQLITTLVNQIHGRIELDTSSGTEFKIDFPAVGARTSGWQ